MDLFKKVRKKSVGKLYSPISGKAVAITDVPDPTFAEGMLGSGVAIEPNDGNVYAPCDGIVDTMFATGHAISLVADFGAEVLIHVGLETVRLDGKPFVVHVANGDKVKKGQLLMEADLEAIKTAGLSVITPVVVCNTDDFPAFQTVTGKDVTNNDVVIELGR